jgi:hypothetical protein
MSEPMEKREEARINVGRERLASMQRQTANRRERSQNPVGDRIDMRSQHSLKGLHKAGTRAATNYNKLANVRNKTGRRTIKCFEFWQFVGVEYLHQDIDVKIRVYRLAQKQLYVNSTLRMTVPLEGLERGSNIRTRSRSKPS